MPKADTRNRIVEKADVLFYEGGFEATSFADIAKSIGISRGNFYHHFKTKDDILDAVIDLRMDRTATMLDDWKDQSGDARDRILSFVNILIANKAKIMAFGCPVGTLCSELAKLDHAAQGKAQQIFGLFRCWLKDQFAEIGFVKNADDHALHLLAWSQGVASLATAFRNEAFVRKEVAGIEAWLDAAINQNINSGAI